MDSIINKLLYLIKPLKMFMRNHLSFLIISVYFVIINHWSDVYIYISLQQITSLETHLLIYPGIEDNRYVC